MRTADPDGLTRLVYVPTNRPFEAAFRSVVDEVESVRAGSDVRLLVIDDCAPEASRANGELAGWAARERGCDVEVLTPDRWRGLVNDIVAMIPSGRAEAARSALLKPTGSYGAGPNKASLVAAVVGAATLHRRDSDQITGVDPASGRSPLDVELELLGTTARCAGSSLTGEPTLDRRDLQADSPDFARRIDDLSRRSRARGPAAAPERRVVEGGVAVERDQTGAVEMGIAALRDVHEWIPEMPAVGILGSDYFQKGLLYQLDVPVLYHELSARHVYEPWRAEQNDAAHLGWYAVAEMRFSILRAHWNTFNEALRERRTDLLGDEFDSALYGDLFVGALESGAERSVRIATEFAAIYKEAAAGASGAVRDRLDVRVAALEGAVDDAPGYVAEAIREFAGLARMWPDLVKAADRLGRRHGRRLPG